MKSYAFEIPGTPVPKARPRASTRGGHVVMYTPTASKNFEFQVKQVASREIPIPLRDAIAIIIELELPRPKRLYWKTKPTPRIYCDKRPDIDNLAKSICDGLNGIAYRDDGQIAKLMISKFYHAGNDHPKTIIKVSSL